MSELHPSAPWRSDEPTSSSPNDRRGVRRLSISLKALLCLVGMVACASVALLPGTAYEGNALIKINERPPFIAYPPDDDASENARYLATQRELIRSAIVLDRVLANPTVVAAAEIIRSRDKVAYLRERLRIDRVGESDFYNVTCTAQSPQLAASVANLVADEYLKVQLVTSYEQYRRNIELLNNERLNRASQVEALRLKVQRLTEEVRQARANADAASKSVELEFAQDELAREEHVLERIESRRLVLETESRAPPRVSVLKYAAVPVRSVSSKPRLRVIAALIGIVFFGACLFYFAVIKRNWSTQFRLTAATPHEN